MGEKYYQFDIWFDHKISDEEKLNYSLFLNEGFGLEGVAPYWMKGMTPFHDTLFFKFEDGSLDIENKRGIALCDALNSLKGVQEWKFRRTTKENIKNYKRLETSLESPSDWQ